MSRSVCLGRSFPRGFPLDAGQVVGYRAHLLEVERGDLAGMHELQRRPAAIDGVVHLAHQVRVVLPAEPWHRLPRVTRAARTVARSASRAEDTRSIGRMGAVADAA